MMTADQQRWIDLKAGKKAALAHIYESEVDALYRYGRQFTADASLVEDAIQELFIELWEKRSGLGTTDAIRPYLLVALRRKIIRKLQQAGKRYSDAEPEDVEMEAVTSIEAQIITAEDIHSRESRIRSALQQLPGRQREVLYLKYFEGYNYKEISELIGLNHQSVRNTATRALQALRKSLLVCLWWIILIKMSTLDVLMALYQ